ncbi:hypothetical protein BV898_19146 [Hypsibius exemplaris]|uniref:Receptor ligand binding region domain-containing protein n=1 Tax=Hypsibius exemplaris TaxID=2072580 RepID=A0A9X6NIH9_HYPEX|nr:hypothetical protein BV898_19146 [Hypsibius exemplaris]
MIFLRQYCAIFVWSVFGIPIECLVQVEIACPGFVDTRRGDGALGFSAPAFEAAVEESNHRYSGILNFSAVFLSEEERTQALDGAVLPGDACVELVAHWYYTQRRFPSDGVSIIMGTGQADWTRLHELAANWNTLYFQTVSYVRSGYRLPAAPVLSTGPVSLLAVGQTFVNLLQFYRWRTVYLVSDLDSPGVFNGLARQLDDLSGADSFNFTVFRRVIKARSLERSREPYGVLLDDFCKISRVMVFFGRANFVRRMLIDAWTRNMTNGEYVYLSWGSADARRHDKFGNFSWSYDDHHDEIARRAFGSLLVIQQLEPVRNERSLSALASLLAQLRQRVRKLFNISYTEREQPREEVVASYASIILLAQNLASTSIYRHDAPQLAQRFLNRTFSGEFDDIYFDGSGMRRRQTAVLHLSERAEQLEMFLLESTDGNSELQEVRNISRDWPGNSWPPRNEPLCGYNNERAVCQKLVLGSFIAELTVSCLGCVLLVGTFTGHRLLRIHRIQYETGWVLEHQHLRIRPILLTSACHLSSASANIHGEASVCDTHAEA